MCNAWPCCKRWFNVGRIDPDTGRFLWRNLIRGPEARTYYGWEACDIAALPGTSDVVVMVHRHDPDPGFDEAPASRMRITRVSSDGAALWEREPPRERLVPLGLGSAALRLDANAEHIFVGEASYPTPFDGIIPDRLLVLTFEGELVFSKDSTLLGDELGTTVLASPVGGCLAAGESTFRLDAAGATLWSSSDSPLCRTPDGHFVLLHVDGSDLIAQIRHEADGSLIDAFTITGHGAHCAAFLGDHLWIGHSEGITRYRTSDWSVVDTLVPQYTIQSLAGSDLHQGMFATTTGSDGESVFAENRILCFHADGALRWSEPWGTSHDIAADVVINGDHPSFSNVSTVCVSASGAVFVCGNQASR